MFKNKILILYGPRQAGKTTLVKELAEKYGDEKSYINCEILENRQALSSENPLQLKTFLGKGKFFVFDEAQKVSNIGISLKLLHDTFPEIQIIATGSSSFELSNKINEPLTGRSIEFKLYPISYSEMSGVSNRGIISYSSIYFGLWFLSGNNKNNFNNADIFWITSLLIIYSKIFLSLKI